MKDIRDNENKIDRAFKQVDSDSYGRLKPCLTICITGRFESFSYRTEVENLIVYHGGRVTKQVTSATDCLVIGGQGSRSWLHPHYGKKIQRALVMQQQGHPIEILGEFTWLERLKSTDQHPPHPWFQTQFSFMNIDDLWHQKHKELAELNWHVVSTEDSLELFDPKVRLKPQLALHQSINLDLFFPSSPYVVKERNRPQMSVLELQVAGLYFLQRALLLAPKAS